MKRRLVFLLLVLGLISVDAIRGQSPAPVIIMQPATPAPAVAAKPANATSAASDDQAAILQQLQQMQSDNAATMKKQEAALATLDELQKAAEELKIFSKRG